MADRDFIDINDLPEDLVDVLPEDAPLGHGRSFRKPAEVDQPSALVFSADKSPAFFSGSLPPQYQLDANFARARVMTDRIPKDALMPMGIQGNPSTNAAITSTALKAIAGTATPPVGDLEFLNQNPQSGSVYFAQTSDDNTLISMTNASGATVVLPPAPLATFVQVVAFTTNNQITASTTITDSPGDMLIVVIKDAKFNAGTPGPTVADTEGNVYTKIDGRVDNGNVGTMIFFAQNIKGGSNTITATATSGAVSSFLICEVFEYFGLTSTNALDTHLAVTLGNIAQNSTASIGPIITSNINDLAFVYISAGASTNTYSSGSGWTSRYSAVQQFGEDQVIANSGTSVIGTAIVTGAVQSTAVMFLATFKALSTGNNFPTGWYAFIQNAGQGLVTIKSSAKFDNVIQNIVLPPNSGTLVVWDGANYWTERGINFNNTIQQNGVNKPQEPRLNFLPPITVTDDPANLSSDVAVPIFGPSGINHSTGLVPDPGSVAGITRFLREDGTWISPVGGVNAITGSYTAVVGDYGKLLSFSSGAAYVQSHEADSAGGFQGSITNAFASNNAAGNFLVCAFRLFENTGGQTTSVTDSNGNVWTKALTFQNGSTQRVSELWTAPNAVAGPNTVTVTCTNTIFQTLVAEYFGPFAVQESASATGTSMTSNSGNITTANPLDLLIGFCDNETAQPIVFTPASGWTVRNNSQGNLQLADQIVGATGTYAFSGTINQSVNWGAGIVALKYGSTVLTLPATAPSNKWFIFVENKGSLPLTISPNGNQLDGSASSIIIAGNSGLVIFTDGTNYFTDRGMSPSAIFWLFDWR